MRKRSSEPFPLRILSHQQQRLARRCGWLAECGCQLQLCFKFGEGVGRLAAAQQAAADRFNGYRADPALKLQDDVIFRATALSPAVPARMTSAMIWWAR